MHRLRNRSILILMIALALGLPGCGDSAGDGGGTGTQAPTVDLTSPGSGATVSGTVSITATAERAEVVRFEVDGTEIASDSDSPYATSWNSASVADGSHTLRAVAEGAARPRATRSESPFRTAPEA